MSTMLRYVKYLRQTQDVITRRLNIVPNHVEVSPGRLSLQLHQVPKLTKGYATQSSSNSAQQFQGYEKSFQNLELQLRKSGRTTKPHIERILGEIELAGNIPSLEGLLLVRCCGKPLIELSSSESIQLVQEVWNTLEKLNVPIDVSHYNTLLNVYLEKNHKFSPDKFMETMKTNNIELNRVTYQRLIAGYCQSGNIDGATKILAIMHEKGIPICENIFNSLITGHSEANDLESAIEILKTMENSGIQHSADTYAALLLAFAKRGDIKSINETQIKIDNLEIQFQDHHLMDILICLAVNGHTDKALDYSKKLNKEIMSDTEVGRLIVKLVDIKQHDLAIKILKNTTNDSIRHQARSTFLIRGLINNKSYKNDEVINICCMLEDENLHSRAFVTALYHVLSNNYAHNRAIDLMKAYSTRGGEIREHYFWPLIREYTRESNIDSVNDTLKLMINDFKITPSIETLKDYVIPSMFGTYDNIIEQLTEINIPKDDIIISIASRLIYERKLRNAAIFITSHPGKYTKEQFLKQLVESLNYRDDIKSFVIILRYLTNDNNNTENVDIDNTSREIVDDAVRQCLTSVLTFKTKIIIKLMNELVESGLSISQSVADEVCLVIEKHKLTPEINDLINKLTCGQLKQVPMAEYNSYLSMKSSSNDDYQRGKYEVIDLRRQFAFNIENKDDKGIYDILKKMETNDYSSAAVYAQAIDIFCEVDNLDAATEFINKFDDKYKNEKLDHRKILKYATLLVKNDRFTDAIQFISEKRIPEGEERKSRGIAANVRKLLDTVVDTKHVDNLEQLFNFLKTKNYVDIDSFVLGPLVKIHIERNDLAKALDTFEHLCIEYKCTPFKNVLSMAFIEIEDANSLQKLTDLCTGIHGESNALVDLAFVFLECGRIKQAKKILETTGVQIYNDKLINSIQRFVKINKYDCLEQMTKITKNIVRLDRGLLYNTLLDVHIVDNDWQRGLALWIEMQENDVQPTSYFLNKLGDLLTKNNQPIPFIFSNKKAPIINKKKSSNSNKKTSMIYEKQTSITNKKKSDKPRTIRGTNFDINLTNALLKKNWEEAENICRKSQNSKKEIRGKFGRLIRALVDNNELDKALILTRSVIEQGLGVRRYLFTDFCDKLIDEKRFNDIEKLSEILNDSMINELAYSKVLSKINILNNGVLNFIENIKIDVTNDDTRSVEKNIHFGQLAHSLLRDTSLLPEYEKWARNLADKGITRGMQTLWNVQFINESSQADNLWTEYIVKNNKPLIKPIIDVGISKKDPELIKRLIQKLDEHPDVNINSKFNALSGLIAIYTSLGQIDDALDLLDNVTKTNPIELFSRDILHQLKNKIEQSGKIFPYVFDKRADDAVSEEPLEGSAKM